MALTEGLIIGLGMWIGSIMLFNVWVLIWPNQQKILGLVPASDEQKAKARKVALLASRTNFALSIPLFCAWVRHTRPAVLRSAPAGRGRMIASIRSRSAGHNCPGRGHRRR